MTLLNLVEAPPLALEITEYHLFGAAGLISLAAFVGLILMPALGAYGRTWEKFAAGFLSLFVLAALVLLGIAIGVYVFYEWDAITDFL
jgi:hypothetical protein